MHTEQMMLSRHLNIRSKELLTVSRLRILRESSQRGRLGTGAIAAIRESDLAVIEKLIESDSVSAEMYQERLDEILSIGHEADVESAAGVSPRGPGVDEGLGRYGRGLDQGFERGRRRSGKTRPRAQTSSAGVR